MQKEVKKKLCTHEPWTAQIYLLESNQYKRKPNNVILLWKNLIKMTSAGKEGQLQHS